MFCCSLLYVHSSIAIILMGKRELVALLNLSSWCLVMVERHFPVVPWGCLRFVIVVFPDHTHLLFSKVSHYTISYRSFKHFNEVNFINDLQAIPWDLIIVFDDPNDILEAWTNLFLEEVDKHIPIKNTGSNGKPNLIG